MNMLVSIVSNQCIMQSINIRLIFHFGEPSVSFAFFVCLLPLLLGMIKGAYFRFVASGSLNTHNIQMTYIAEYSFIFVRMIQPFDCSMALVALEAFVTFVPSETLNKNFTIFSLIFEYFRWPSEISQVMRKDTALRIMRIFPVWAPRGLILEHIESVVFYLSEHFTQVDLQELEV